MLIGTASVAHEPRGEKLARRCGIAKRGSRSDMGANSKMGAPCPICKQNPAHLLATGEDFEYGSLPGPFEIWRCDACGHGYLDPLPAPDQLPILYPSTYYTVNPRSPIHFDGFIYRAKMRRDVDRIVGLALERKPSSVVDLGCGDAERLAQVGERLGEDVELIGVDMQPDPTRMDELASRGVRVVRANLEEGLSELQDGAHDLVIMCQIIEHLRDPAAALESVSKKLAPNGRLLIETPHQGGLDFRLMKSRYWGGYHFPRHFHVFTTDTLAYMVNQVGLRVARTGFMPSGFGIVGLRNQLGLSSIERGPRFWEFLHMRNLLVVGAFAALDTAWIAIGGETSNQFLVAEKPGSAAS